MEQFLGLLNIQRFIINKKYWFQTIESGDSSICKKAEKLEWHEI